jgi:hypothetical protein
VSWRVVSQSVWQEVAFWRTAVSGLKGWQWRCFRWGFRLVTPWFGTSVGVWV